MSSDFQRSPLIRHRNDSTMTTVTSAHNCSDTALRASLIRNKGIPITDPHFWQCEDECTLDVLRQVFRSCTDDEMPLLSERLSCLREAGQVLYEVCLPGLDLVDLC